MKKLILLIAFGAFVSVNRSAAQDFKAMLGKTFTAFDTTRDFAEKVSLSNKLDLIAKKWSDEWAAHYYCALSKAILSHEEKDEAKRDVYIDDAEKERDEAVSLLKAENDETEVLAAVIAQARLSVNPQSRWQKYGKLFDQHLAKAKELNPDNPRIYYLQGTSKFFTPKMFGGGKKAALPYFEKAETLFAKEVSTDITKPSWGRQETEYFLKQAKGDDDN